MRREYAHYILLPFENLISFIQINYEHLRNAELIENQRWEDTEERRKSEYVSLFTLIHMSLLITILTTLSLLLYILSLH